MGKVICDNKNDTCTHYCVHSAPHETHIDGEIGNCGDGGGWCGYRNDEPFCICIPTP